MPLLSYEDVKPRAEAIKQSVVRGAMPPWPADPKHSLKFKNDPRLSPREIDTLVAWVNAGAPEGNDADLPPLPAVNKGVSPGWLHPKGLAPDAVIKLPEFHIPATGEIPYVRYMIKVPFSGDKWVVALQVLPSNRALVHHMAIAEVKFPNGVAPADLDGLAQVEQKLGLPKGSMGPKPAVPDPSNPAEYDMLGVYTPGTTFEAYPEGSAKLLKGGENMYLNFNIHYQTSGKPEVDQPQLALWFQPDPPKHQIFRVPASGATILADGKELLTDSPGEKAEGTNVAIPPIPPNAENYEVVGITAYTEPVTIYQLQPHAHLRGKDFTYTVIYPDGREETVLSVPKYDFHSQFAYALETPLHLPAGSKLVVIAHYDNSMRNEHLHHHHGASGGPGDAASEAAHNFATDNFGTDKEVYFREANQSWDEMFTPFIQYSVDLSDKGLRDKALSNKDLSDKDVAHHPRIVEVVGCLEQGSSGMWMLTHASEPMTSDNQATSTLALRAAAAQPLGDRREQLLGVSVFNPSNHKGQKTAVKGVLIDGARSKSDDKQSRLNVTSLQTVAASCF